MIKWRKLNNIIIIYAIIYVYGDIIVCIIFLSLARSLALAFCLLSRFLSVHTNGKAIRLGSTLIKFLLKYVLSLNVIRVRDGSSDAT